MTRPIDYVRPAAPCDVGCNRGWLECGAIDDDESHVWIQMCDNCTSDGFADDELASKWAEEDGRKVGRAIARPFGVEEPFDRPVLLEPDLLRRQVVELGVVNE